MDLRSIPPPVEGIKPLFNLTPALAGKTVASLMLMAVGAYYLDRGRKHQEAGNMVLGAALILAGLFVFF